MHLTLVSQRIYALVLGLQFYETSAKDNINVKTVFEKLVDIICDKMAESLDSDPNMIPNQHKGENLQYSSCIDNLMLLVNQNDYKLVQELSDHQHI